MWKLKEEKKHIKFYVPLRCVDVVSHFTIVIE